MRLYSKLAVANLAPPRMRGKPLFFLVTSRRPKGRSLKHFLVNSPPTGGIPHNFGSDQFPYISGLSGFMRSQVHSRSQREAIWRRNAKTQETRHRQTLERNQSQKGYKKFTCTKLWTDRYISNIPRGRLYTQTGEYEKRIFFEVLLL